jgi:DNA-binding GntR family transcriptional regulator
MSSQFRTVSVVEAIAQDLRHRLFSGAFQPDSFVTELDVATTYDVARPTAKAAIERLVAEGLLVRNANKSARVRSMSPEDIRDVYFTRFCLEREAIRVLTLSRSFPEEALVAIAEVRAVGAISSLTAVEPDVRFHLMLVRAVGSPRMERLYQNIMGEVRMCMAQVQSGSLLRASVIADEHEHIVKHIAEGDVDASIEELAGHLERARDRLLAATLPPPAKRIRSDRS